MKKVHYILIGLILLITGCSVAANSAGMEQVTWAQGYGWAPDGAISVVDGSWYFASAVNGIRYASGSGQTVTTPSGNGTDYNRDYSAPGSVLKIDNLFVMFNHGELHPCGGYFPFVAGIGVSVSNDGITWNHLGQVLAGDPAVPACSANRAWGNGYPSAVVVGDYIYLYFVDWGNGPDQVHVARCPKSQIFNISCWNKFYAGGWGEPGIGGRSTAVVTMSNPQAQTYLATPQIQIVGGVFVGVFESNDGFYMATSVNGTLWQNYQRIFTFPVLHTQSSGENWYSYPSILRVDGSWWLYFARQDASNIHHMWRMPLQAQMPTPTPSVTAAP